MLKPIPTQIQKMEIDWTDIKNECRHTVNKESTDKPATKDFICKLMISEHSPIRLAKIKWRWEGLKSWISVHFVRHHEGVEKFVSTQRTDRTGVDRNALTQDAPVNIDIEANAQALINMSRVRLCRQASPETRAQFEDLKKVIKEAGQEEIAFAMQPNCVYRCGCPEFKSCGYWQQFVKLAYVNNVSITDIMSRYNFADAMFYGEGKS